MHRNLEKAYKFYIQKTGDNINIDEFLDNMNKLNSYKLTDNIKSNTENDLNDVAGGKDMIKNASALLTALTIMMPQGNAHIALSPDKESPGSFNVLTLPNAKNGNFANEKDSIESYICDEKVSEAEEKVAKIINEYSQTNTDRHISTSDKVSSYRWSGESEKSLTEIEKILDKSIQDGDLPIKSFTVKELDDLKSKYAPKLGINPEYIIVENDCNAIDLQDYCSNGAIVQVASQFNAVESTNSSFSPVKRWFYDKTQGPMVSLQSVSACKHRESALLLGKLPNSMKDIIDNFMVKKKHGFLNLFKKDVKITEKYEDLYQGGYLNLYEIGEDNLDDLKQLAKYLSQNKSNLGINAQWVICEKTGKKQFQVFCAAPSFQGYCDLNWDDLGDKRIAIFKDICINLVVEQYRAMAQIVAIKSTLSGKQEEIHFYQVGQGAFHNPEEVMPLALEAVAKELKGYNVKVYLHNGYLKKNNKWKTILDWQYDGINKLSDILGNIKTESYL